MAPMLRIVLFLLVAALLAPLARAQPLSLQPLRLETRLIDLARVPSPVLRVAIAEVQRQFSLAGISLVVGGPAVQPDVFVRGCVPPTLVILAEAPFRRAGPDGGVLGYTAAGAPTHPRAAMISYHRVEIVAGRFRLSFGALLGLVLAHELAHLILSQPGHHEWLMKPTWDADDLIKAAAGSFTFSPAHAERLVRRVRDISLQQPGCTGGRIDQAPVP